MPQDTAQQVQLREQIAKEMADALGDCDWKQVLNALENSLDMHHAQIVETVAGEQGPHHRGRKAD